MTAHRSDQSVIVVGAGPTGLTLACELAAAGVSVTVLERRAAPSTESRAMSLYGRTMELLDLRGHAEPLTALGRPVGRLGTVGGSALDFTELDSGYPQLNVVPQSRTEELLERHARDLGVVVERNVEVCGLVQDGLGVTLQVRTPAGEWEESAGYVVGCDGAHSVVRDHAGIAFRGRTYNLAPVLADVRLRTPPPGDALLLPGRGRLLLSIPFGDGYHRIAVLDAEQSWNRDPVTLRELRTLLTWALGFDPEPYDPRWLARFRIHQRIADQYRTGRVLLAGDAAHLHSPLGGQGLNLGIQDAVNLGWKLAAEVNGWAPAGLLDSYESERRPQALKVLRATHRATRVATSTSKLLSALRSRVLPVVLAQPRLRRRAAEALAGLHVRYPAGAAGATQVRGPRPALRAGMRVPDLLVPLRGEPPVRLYESMRDGRFVLLDLTPDGALAARAEPWDDRVHALAADLPLPALGPVSALLVRPDGHAAWVGTEQTPALEARVTEQLLRWCGAPSPARAATAVAPTVVAQTEVPEAVREIPARERFTS